MKDDLFENARPESTKLRLVLAWLCQSKAKPSHLKIKWLGSTPRSTKKTTNMQKEAFRNNKNRILFVW